jgi:phosphoglycerate kinase
MKLPVVDETVRNKKVLLRGDIDVPIKPVTQLPGNPIKIEDDTRLKAIWPTIDFLLKNNCQVTLCGHVGRPAPADATARQTFSAKLAAEWLINKINKTSNPIKSIRIRGFDAFAIASDFCVLENLRFDAREEDNDEGFARELAGLAEVYVNEAFAACERAHASIVGVPQYLPHYAGIRLAEEVKVLTNILENPKRPLVTVIGGAKIETKLPLIEKMAGRADVVVVGGELANQIIDNRYGTKVRKLELREDGKDVALDSLCSVYDSLAAAGTIVWNGPLGMIEEKEYQEGTRRLAEMILDNRNADKIVGGGDTIAFINKLGLTDKFNWVSTGGGSMLKFLSGEKLPGIEALIN